MEIKVEIDKEIEVKKDQSVELPKEIWTEIFLFFNLKQHCSISLVCVKFWKCVSSDEFFLKWSNFHLPLDEKFENSTELKNSARYNTLFQQGSVPRILPVLRAVPIFDAFHEWEPYYIISQASDLWRKQSLYKEDKLVRTWEDNGSSANFPSTIPGYLFYISSGIQEKVIRAVPLYGNLKELQYVISDIGERIILREKNGLFSLFDRYSNHSNDFFYQFEWKDFVEKGQKQSIPKCEKIKKCSKEEMYTRQYTEKSFSTISEENSTFHYFSFENDNYESDVISTILVSGKEEFLIQGLDVYRCKTKEFVKGVIPKECKERKDAFLNRKNNLIIMCKNYMYCIRMPRENQNMNEFKFEMQWKIDISDFGENNCNLSLSDGYYTRNFYFKKDELVRHLRKVDLVSENYPFPKCSSKSYYVSPSLILYIDFDVKDAKAGHQVSFLEFRNQKQEKKQGEYPIKTLIKNLIDYFFYWKKS